MAESERIRWMRRLAQWTSDWVLPSWQPGWQDLVRQMPDVALALTEQDRLRQPLRGWQPDLRKESAVAAVWTEPASGAVATAAAWVLPGVLVVGTAAGEVLALTASAHAGAWVHRLLGRHAGAVLDIQSSRRKGEVVSLGADGALQRYQVLGGKGLAGRWVQEPGQHAVLALHPGAEIALTSPDTGMMRLWDLGLPGHDLPKAQWRGHQRAVTGARFVANGQQLVTASQDGTVKLWSMTEGSRREPVRVREHAVGFRRMWASDDAQWVVTVDDNGGLQWWGLLEEGAQPMRGSWGSGADRDRLLAVSPARDLVAVGGSDGMVHLLPLGATGTPSPLIAHQAHQGSVRALAFSASGNELFTAGEDGLVRRWSLTQTGGAEFATLARHDAGLRTLALNAEGQAGASMDIHGGVQVWSSEGPAAPQHRCAWRGREGVTGVAAFGDDGHDLLTTGWFGERCHWILDGDAEPHPLPQAGDRASAARLALWLSDRRQTVTVGIDQTAALWDMSPPAAGTTAAPLRSWGVGDHLLALQWSAPLQRLVSTGWDRRLALWDLDAPQVPALVAKSPAHPDVPRALALLPDGLRAVTGCDDGRLRLWDLARLEGASPLAECGAHEASINQLTMFDSGRAVLSVCNDHTLVVWRGLDQPQPGGPQVLRGHQEAVLAAAVSDAGDRAVSAGADGSVRLWDLAAGSLLATWTGHGQAVYDVLITPDGRRAVSAGADGSVRVWDLSQPSRADALFVLTGRGAAKALRLQGERLIVVEAGGLALWRLQPERAACERRLTLLGTDLLLVLEPAGIRLRHLLRPIQAVNHDGARVPADPDVFGAMSFMAGDQGLDARDLAERLEWPDEPQPRQFRVRWRDEQERDHWLPRLRPFAPM